MDDDQDVDKVEGIDDGEEDPGWLTREEQGIASTRVVEQKRKGLLGRRMLGDELGHGPNDQAEEDWV
jgi:hypothetical protein